MLDRGTLERRGEADPSTALLAALRDQPGEASLHPIRHRPGSSEDQRSVTFDRNQLDRGEPDLERRLADVAWHQCASGLPHLAITGARGRDLSTSRVDRRLGTSRLRFATALGDVALLDEELASAKPPFRGWRVLRGSLVPRFLPRARSLAQFLAPFVTPFSGRVSPETVRSCHPFTEEAVRT